MLLGWLAFALTSLSCDQYEYTSPNPGIVELRLRVKNSRTDILPFAPSSRFNIILYDIFLVRNDGAFLEVLPDLFAIRRSTDGTSLNCLSIAARDSQVIIGKVYAPPGTYTRFGNTRVLTHDPFVTVFRVPQLPNLIPVRNLTGETDKFFEFVGTIPSITVNESRLTIVTLTLDLDMSLVRRTEWFDWPAPYAYITSIQNL